MTSIFAIKMFCSGGNRHSGTVQIAQTDIMVMASEYALTEVCCMNMAPLSPK